MSTTSRTRLHPAAIVSLVIGGLIIIGALAFLSWFLISTSSTPNQQATQKLVQWQEIFEKYRSAHDTLPEMPAGGYCLGTGFPIGAGGTANCRDYDAETHYTEEASAPLRDALASVSELPQGISAAVRGTVGPTRSTTTPGSDCSPPRTARARPPPSRCGTTAGASSSVRSC